MGLGALVAESMLVTTMPTGSFSIFGRWSPAQLMQNFHHRPGHTPDSLGIQDTHGHHLPHS